MVTAVALGIERAIEPETHERGDIERRGHVPRDVRAAREGDLQPRAGGVHLRQRRRALSGIYDDTQHARADPVGALGQVEPSFERIEVRGQARIIRPECLQKQKQVGRLGHQCGLGRIGHRHARRGSTRVEQAQDAASEMGKILPPGGGRHGAGIVIGRRLREVWSHRRGKDGVEQSRRTGRRVAREHETRRALAQKQVLQRHDLLEDRLLQGTRQFANKAFQPLEETEERGFRLHGGQSFSTASTCSACSSGLTRRKIASMRPCSSMTNVERSVPIDTLPAKFFSTHTP